ncbi:phosphotransferase [Histophilus somni]|uniref:phosphotransferase n=1 Tax=Histophilus somni TaxID=731 RepID=UPI00201EFE87|nr:phosphotransferase [Histophilus somni]
MSLPKYVEQLLKEKSNVRVFSFKYDGKSYWLKQTEKLSFIWRFLKSNPAEMLKSEIIRLQELNKKSAPVPKLVLFGDNFFVTEDVGSSANTWVENEDLSIELRNKVLFDCAQALASLHKQNITHGRPALRDMIWCEEKVIFVDFECTSSSNNIDWQKIRDGLVFIHSLGRSSTVSDEQIALTVTHYRQYCDADIWQKTADFIYKYRWAYYVLRIFKPVARMDLIAIYRLFEAILKNQATL